MKDEAGVAPIGVFGVDVALGVCGLVSSMLRMLLVECRRDWGLESPALPNVLFLATSIPGNPSSLFSALGAGVCVGSTETTDLIGNTRSVAEGLTKGDSEGVAKGEPPVGTPADMLRLAPGGIGWPLDCHKVSVDACGECGTTSEDDLWWPCTAKLLSIAAFGEACES